MKSFLLFCLVLLFSLSMIFTISENPSFAQELDEPVVNYSEPKIISGDPTRCKMETLANGHQMTISFLTATASSLESKRDSLKCRVETEAVIQLKKGWYFHSIEHTVGGGIIQSPQSKAVLAVQSTFQNKSILRLKETKSNPLISKSNRLLVNSTWSKAKQCSGEIPNITGKSILNFDAQTQGDAQSSLNSFDTYLIFAGCDYNSP